MKANGVRGEDKSWHKRARNDFSSYTHTTSAFGTIKK